MRWSFYSLIVVILAVLLAEQTQKVGSCYVYLFLFYLFTTPFFLSGADYGLMLNGIVNLLRALGPKFADDLLDGPLAGAEEMALLLALGVLIRGGRVGVHKRVLMGVLLVAGLATYGPQL